MRTIWAVTFEQEFSYEPGEWQENTINVLAGDDAEEAVAAVREAALKERGNDTGDDDEIETDSEPVGEWSCTGFRLLGVRLEAQAEIEAGVNIELAFG